MPRNTVNQPGESGRDEEQETMELIGAEAARCFLTQIHQGRPGRLEIRTNIPDTQHWPKFWPRTLDEAVATAMAKCATENIYYGVCSRRDRSSGKKNNVSHFPGVWVDVDFKDFKGGEREAWEKIDAFSLKPTIIVHTGGGLHLYFLLNEPIPVTPDLVLELEALNKAFAQTLGGDHCHSLDHILRIPGTTNWPDARKRQRGRVPAPVRLLVHDGPRYTLEQLQAVAPTLPPKFLNLLKRNAKIKATWEGKRLDLDDDSRSGYDISMTSQLVSHGFTDDEIIAILREMPSGRGAEATQDYLRRTINTARQNQTTRPSNPTNSPADLADAYLHNRGLNGTDGLRLRNHRQTWLRYGVKHYERLGDHELRADIIVFLRQSPAREKTTQRLVSNVVEHLQGICSIPDAVTLPARWDGACWIPSRDWIAVENGLVDLSAAQTGKPEVHPHTPSFVTLVLLPFALNPSAKCTRWRKFVAEILPDPATRKMLQELFGYCLLQDARYQRFFIFEGTGANGKSVVLLVLVRLLGQTNISTVPLELFSASHNLTETLGKLANIASEVGEVDKVAEGVLKQFVGGDYIHFNPKYKSPFSAQPTAKLIIATNVRPPFRDRTLGLWRRLALIPFPVTVPLEKQDPTLVDQLAEELSGILNWALDGLQSLRRRGQFEESAVSLKAKNEFQHEANPVRVFLDEQCLVDPNGTIPITNLYLNYKLFCEENGYHPLNEAHLGREVRLVFPHIKRNRVTKKFPPYNNDRPYVYQGIIWRQTK